MSAGSVQAKVRDSDSLGQPQYNFPAGFVRVSDEPRGIFFDPFDSTLDTTNRWNAPVATGGGVAASVTSSVLTLGTGTTAGGYSYLQSQPTFLPVTPSWLGVSFGITLEFPLTTNANRFWGAGSLPATPTAAVPITDGYGFEVDLTGALNAVVFASGTRTVIATLTPPVDAATHRYVVYYRTDKIYWYIDSLTTPLATSNFQAPNVQTLPVALAVVANTSAPASSRVITATGVSVWDTGKNQTQLSDGTYPWRKVSVSTAGGLSVAGTTAPGVTAVGNPVRAGAIARTANPTAVADGQISNVLTDKLGRLVTVSSHVRDLVGIQTTATTTTAETTIVTAGAAGVFNDITSLTITNASATATIVTIKDSTAGTTRAIYNLGANGGITLPFNPPMPQSTTANNWTITSSAAVNLNTNVIFVKNI